MTNVIDLFSRQILVGLSSETYIPQVKKASVACRPKKESIYGLKYFPRLGVWKQSSGNNQFNPESMIATSYGWWEYVKVIKGKVVFNNYRYSTTTSKHQSNMRGLLRHLGIEIDLEIEAPQGLQDLHAAIDYYVSLIDGLNREIHKKGSKKAKNRERETAILQHQHTIKQIKKLGGIK